jgi:glycine hydroxymethyltransferase
MDLSNGGHLTHGSPATMSGKYFNFIPYKVNSQTERIDFDQVRKLAVENKPKLIVAGASAYPRIIEADKFREIADEVGAMLMVDMAHFAGLVAAGVHPNPVEHAHIVTTTTHKTLRGPRAEPSWQRRNSENALIKLFSPECRAGADAYHCRKSGLLQGSFQPEFVAYQKQVLLNSQKMAKNCWREDSAGIRGTDNHLVLLNDKQEYHWQGCGTSSRRRQHHDE